MTDPIDRAGPIRCGEELDVPRLERYLQQELCDESGTLSVEQFPSGFSNLTYLLRLGDRELVLRRPPFGNTVKSAHDMGREYGVLSKLSGVYPPSPKPLVYCDDPAIVGAEFYVMERRRGVVLRGADPPESLKSSPDLARQLCEAFIDNLAALHRLDYRAAGLGDLGRPEGYIERQVTGWTKRYQQARTDDVSQIEQLGEWLIAHQPPNGAAALIHNDYKYDNLLLDPNDLTRIVALLDWEMATIGDPLMDLGTTLAYWVEPGDSEAERQRAFGPTMAAGSLTRQQLVERYRKQTGFDVPAPLFYYAFGLFKLAVIVQQIYARYHHGLTQDKRFARLNQMVESLGIRGSEAINNGEI